ncbi:MAG TPA: glycosyltransferase family 4 protein [Ktedonosporobacter sp.]|nr:glycosyltransferase family 4 protein [Ktedonosporobacter sp.]
MKIAHIAPPWIAVPPKNYGGTEIVIHHLVEEQVALGHDVTLFAPGDAQASAKLVSFFPKSLIDTGVPWPAHLKAFYHYYKSVEFIKTHRFDIVHAHLSSSSDMYIFPLSVHLATPLIATIHSRFPFDRVGEWTGNADQYYLEWMRSVPLVAISKNACDDVPYFLDIVGVVHHGLPMAPFIPTMPEDFFLWLGRITADKGTHLAIQAAREAGVPLVLAGTVDKHVEEAVQYFEELIKPQIDGQQITYIGPVDMQQKTDLLRRARCLLNPIQWEEPFGMVMIEAMALGCPVISFARGSAPEIVAHRTSGFLVHDLHEMVHYIARVDELDRATVRAYAEQHFSVRAMAEKYFTIYRKVMVTSLTEPALSSSVMTPVLVRTPLKTFPVPAGETMIALDSTVQTTRKKVEVEQNMN